MLSSRESCRTYGHSPNSLRTTAFVLGSLFPNSLVNQRGGSLLIHGGDGGGGGCYGDTPYRQPARSGLSNK